MNKPEATITDAVMDDDEQLCNEATEGPWLCDTSKRGTEVSPWVWAETEDNNTVPIFTDCFWDKADCEFIARARSALPEYVIEVRRLREEIEKLKEDKESLFLEVGETRAEWEKSKQEIKQLKSANAMGCENPPTNCECTGCFVRWCDDLEVDMEDPDSLKKFESYIANNRRRLTTRS